MKLKEKLAKEYADEQDDYDRCEQCFIAGFEKAREMATEVHAGCGAACGCCLDKMESMGEE